MALGAQRSDVLKLVLVRSLKLISAGTIIGLSRCLNEYPHVASIALQRERIRRGDIRAGHVLLGAIALAASYLPAMRATRADPMVVLGHNT
jgi:hypothetical protein